MKSPLGFSTETEDDGAPVERKRFEAPVAEAEFDAASGDIPKAKLLRFRLTIQS